MDDKSIHNKDNASESLSEGAKNGDVNNYESHSHHHHHHSHHHHSKHKHHRHHKRHSSSKSGNKLIKFFKQHRSVLVNILSCTVSVVLLIVLAFVLEKQYKAGTDNDVSIDITKSTIKIESSIFIDEVPLVKQAIFAYLDDTNDLNANSVYKKYGGYEAKLNVGLPVSYTYRIVGLPDEIFLKEATLDVGRSENYEDVKTYVFEDDAESIDIYHLMPGTKYYYRLNLTLSTGNVIKTTGEFSTADSPRILSIDGILNVRDIGGWKTSSGGTIKHGLLYRGSELDGAVEPTYLLTERGLRDMILTLGIRFDMDLRSPTDTKGDALGANIIHENYSVGMYSEIFNDENKLRIREIFSDLANKDNYPIYMHCTYGRDRTGTICYLLEALLGVSDEDLQREYELSAFTDSYVNLEKFAVLKARIELLDGETTKEKVEGYLLSVGVTAEEISNIRDIFLEEQ